MNKVKSLLEKCPFYTNEQKAYYLEQLSKYPDKEKPFIKILEAGINKKEQIESNLEEVVKDKSKELYRFVDDQRNLQIQIQHQKIAQKINKMKGEEYKLKQQEMREINELFNEL